MKKLTIADYIQKTEERFSEIRATIRKIRNNQILGFDRSSIPNIVDIRPGYKIINGILDPNRKALVFLVSQKTPLENLEPRQRIPEIINGILTDVSPISPFEQVRYSQLDTSSSLIPNSAMDPGFLLDSDKFDFSGLVSNTGRIPQISYVPPPDIQLNEVNEEMTLICHVSPEEGWNQLKTFLEGVDSEFTMGMYDFSAPHIGDAMVGIASRDIPFTLVYDGKPPAGVGKPGNKLNDKTEDEIIAEVNSKAQSSFVHEKASLNKGGLWANAYHIKVAVDHSNRFWLSSGNWQSSNQPIIDPQEDFKTYLKNNNREWHIIISNPSLAKIYHDFLQYDFVQSKAKNEGQGLLPMDMANSQDYLLVQNDLVDLNATPIQKFPAKVFEFNQGNKLRIQPLLTPDNYLPQIIPLLENAKSKIHFQNQYIHITNTSSDSYTQLLTTLLNKSKELECKIILRNEGNVRLMVENLVNFGFDPGIIRIQNNCHNKGIILDDEILVLGSHNYSNYGVEWNRDASLIIYDKEIAAYYSSVYQFDWDHLAVNKVPESSTQTGETTDGLLAAGNQRIANYESLFD